MTEHIAFCATGKTGLGHLRRVTNIATALRERRPRTSLTLVSNMVIDGLTDEEQGLYQRVAVVQRTEMARYLSALGPNLVVVDTAMLPGLHRVEARLCLVLREVIAERLARFRLGRGRAWDLVIFPNPSNGWQISPCALPARNLEAVGWIYRRPRATFAHARGHSQRNRPHTILVASGGGGNRDTAKTISTTLSPLIRDLRTRLASPVEVIQTIGPRACADRRIQGIDRIVAPTANLHEVFARADLVISTAGYNSVLELACLDVPVLLVPVSRTYDDQAKRCREWGPRLGLAHDPDNPRCSVQWLLDILSERRRRPPADPGVSGAVCCAKLLEQLIR